MSAKNPGDELLVDKAIELASLLFAFGRIDRVCFHPDGKRRETDSDHTVMLGVMACAFAKEYAPHLDVGKIAEFALVHDLVEVYAGDTNSFGIATEAQKVGKAEREHEALLRIKREYDMVFPWIGDTIEQYEKLDTPEACFVKFFDKMLPKISHILNKGEMVRELGHTPETTSEFHRTQRADIMNGYGKGHEEVEALYLGICKRVMRECFPPETSG